MLYTIFIGLTFLNWWRLCSGNESHSGLLLASPIYFLFLGLPVRLKFSSYSLLPSLKAKLE